MAGNDLALARKLGSMMEERRETMEESLDGVMTFDQFKALSISYIDSDVDMLNVDPVSLVKALYVCASMGVVPSTKATPQNMRRVSLILYGSEVKAMPEWRLFKEQMESHPDVKSVTPVLVHDDDEIEVDTTENKVLSHKYDPFGSARSFTLAGDKIKGLRGGFLHIVYNNGDTYDYLVTADYINRARKASKQSNKGPWADWTDRQCLKTIVRAGASAGIIPFTQIQGKRIGAAIDADNEAMGYGHDRPKIEITKPVDDLLKDVGKAAMVDNPHAKRVTVVETEVIDDESTEQLNSTGQKKDVDPLAWETK